MGSKQYVYGMMVFIIMFFSLLVFPPCSQADYQTNLFFSGYIQAGSGDLDANDWSAPVVYDWNNDGMKDLLVGQRVTINGVTTGRVSYFENLGTDDAPSFNTSSYVQACSNTCTLQVAGGG